MATSLEVRRLGRIEYAAAHQLQQELIAERLASLGDSSLTSVPDRLLLLEHERVITVGRSPRSEQKVELEALVPGCPVVEIERGGEATWHGPGQLVAYPILYLPEGGRDLHAYLRNLEEVVIQTLADFEIQGKRAPGKTGVWIGSQKVASIGIAVRRWVTWHGVSLNLDNSLEDFGRFHPCGFDSRVMTRVVDHVDGGQAPSMIDLASAFSARFTSRFRFTGSSS